MAYCKNCGNELAENIKFCSNCGAPVSEEVAEDGIQGNDDGKDTAEVFFRPSMIKSEGDKIIKKKGRFIWIALLVLAFIDYYSDPAILTIILSVALIVGCVYCLKKKYKGKVGIIVALVLSVFCLYAGFSQAGEIGLFAVPNEEPVVERVEKPSADKTTPDNKTAVSKEDKPAEEAPAVNKEDKKDAINGVDPDLKAFLDSYEAFMDEYVEFMKKYANNPSDALTMLSEYTKFMEKYTEFAEAVEKYDSDDMSPEDAKYYLEVINRCNMKMLEMY